MVQTILHFQRLEKLFDNVEKVLDEQPETKYYLAGVGKAIPRYDYSIRPLGQGNALGDFSVKIDLKKGGRFKTTSEMVDYLQDETFFKSRWSDIYG